MKTSAFFIMNVLYSVDIGILFLIFLTNTVFNLA